MKSVCILFGCFFMGFSFSYSQDLGEKAIALKNSSDLNDLIQAAGDKKLVLLGEASHGTHEYYIWRDSISRRLISEKDFNFIAVEGDFASLYELNRYVKNKKGAAKSAREVLKGLDRWPQWMWANEEVVGIAEWLRSHNENLPYNEKVGFYGMDVYDEWRSKEMVLDVLKKSNQQLYQKVKEEYKCMSSYKGDSWQYANSVRVGAKSCDNANKNVVELLVDSKSTLNLPEDEYFYLLQNALVFKNAEKFYRKAVASRDASSWNSRVFHMNECIENLLFLYGGNSKGIVWAHNTHIGDASYTSMLQFNQKNIGQLTREKWGKENVFLIGFTTYTGSVMAGSSWGSPREIMQIPEPMSNSAEEKFNQTGMQAGYRIFDENDRNNENLMKPIGNRAIGVVYNPAQDSNQFVPTILPMRYDAKIFFKETKALNPL